MLRKLLALAMCIVLCLALCIPALAVDYPSDTNGGGITATVTATPDSLTAGADGSVTVNVVFSEAIQCSGFNAEVSVPSGWSTNANNVKVNLSNDAAQKAGYNATQNTIAKALSNEYGTDGDEYALVTGFSITYAVTGAAAGDQTVGLTNLEVKKVGLATAYKWAAATAAVTIKLAVTFDANDGVTASRTEAVASGETVAKPSDPERSGYRFLGWFEGDAATAYDFTAPVTESFTLTARWMQLHTVSVDPDNGSAADSYTVDDGTVIAAPTQPQKEGCDFLGWFPVTNGTMGSTAYDFTAPVTGDLSLKAGWEVRTYAVTFDSNGGSAVEQQQVAYGSNASAPVNPTYTGHTFSGWMLGETVYAFNTPVTEAITLTAAWDLETYAVTFNSDGGSTVDAQSVRYMETAAQPADPVYAGHIFKGWTLNGTAYDFAQPVTGAVNLKAEWETIYYAVTFDTDGGAPVPETRSVAAGTLTARPETDPVKDGFDFAGWYQSDKTTPLDFSAYVISEDVTVCALWTAKPVTYTVTFNANGHGTAPASQTVVSGSTAAKPDDLTAEGYTFGGWYADEACTTAFDFTAAIEADTTVYAKWTENTPEPEPEPETFTVTFNANGHGTAPASQTVVSGSTAAKPDDLTAEGYTFGGWYADETCTTAFDFAAAIEADTTVYAKWTEVSGGGVTPYVPVEEPVVAPVTEDTTETETETETPDVTEPVVEESSVTVSAETTEDGEAKAEVSEDAITEALENSEEEVLTVKVDTEDAESVELTLSAEAVQAAADGDVDLHVETEQGTVKLDSATLGELAESGAEIAVTVTANEDGSMKLDVTADGETVDAKIKVELPAAEEGQVLVLVKEDGSEEVIKKSAVEGNTAYLEIPAGATVKAVDTKPTDYTDVPEDAWYADSVDFVSSRSIFQGTGDGFEPETPMNRAMLATVLYRLEDASATGENVFPDVSEDAWYADAVNWAAEEGIVNGTDKGFEPMEIVTREQIATMFYRYAITLGLDVSGRSELSAFTDGSNTSDWAKDAMEWAVSVGLFGGDDQGSLDPQGEASRAVVATLVERMIKLIVK